MTWTGPQPRGPAAILRLRMAPRFGGRTTAQALLRLQEFFEEFATRRNRVSQTLFGCH